jgi:Putative zinc-finger
MKHSDESMSEERTRDLQLLYLEDILDPEQKKEFEEHIRTCDDCTRQLKELAQWIDVLKNNKEAFCPELWEVYEHAQGRDYSAKKIAAHLDQCNSCREAANALKLGMEPQVMPKKLWEVVEAQFPKPALRKPDSFLTEWISGFIEQFSALFRPPLIAAGAVAAAIILVLILYPSDISPPELGLSSVIWKDVDLRSRAMGSTPPISQPDTVAIDRKRLAILVFFQDFKKPFTQRRIDSLYWALRPPESIPKRFEVMSPARIKEAVFTGSLEADNRRAFLQQLHGKLGVSQIVALTVVPSADGFRIQSERLDGKTGKVLRTGKEQRATPKELPSTLKSATQSLFETNDE